MAEFAVNIVKLLAGFLCIVSPVVMLMIVLGRRDRRHRDLSTAVLQLLDRADLRGLFSVSIRTHLFTGDTVSVELWNCSREQVWDVMEGLAERLPRTARFEVNGLTDRRMRHTWRLDPVGCSTGLCRLGLPVTHAGQGADPLAATMIYSRSNNETG